MSNSFSLVVLPSGVGVQRAEPRGDHRGGVSGRAHHAALHGGGPTHLEEVRTSARNTNQWSRRRPSTHSIGHPSTPHSPRPSDPVTRHAEPVAGARTRLSVTLCLAVIQIRVVLTWGGKNGWREEIADDLIA